MKAAMSPPRALVVRFSFSHSTAFTWHHPSGQLYQHSETEHEFLVDIRISHGSATDNLNTKLSLNWDQISFSNISEIHIDCRPTYARDLVQTFTLGKKTYLHGYVVQGDAKPPPTWYRRGTHVPSYQEGLLDKGEAAKSSDARFIIAKGCAEGLCRKLGKRVNPQKTSLLFDFAAYSPMDAREFLDSLRGVGRVRQMQIGFESCDMPKSGRKLIKKFMKQCVDRHVRKFDERPFPFERLPAELQIMVIGHAVTDPAVVMLRAKPKNKTAQRVRAHARQCCGKCRGISAERFNDEQDCRCSIHLDNISSGCQCVTLNAAIFSVSRMMRHEALKLFWKNNTFMAHGTLTNSGLPSSDGPSIMRMILNIQKEHLMRIKHLIIDTDCPPQRLSGPCPEDGKLFGLESTKSVWIMVFDRIRAHASPGLHVEVRINTAAKVLARAGGSLSSHALVLHMIDEWFGEVCEKCVEDVRQLPFDVTVWRRQVLQETKPEGNIEMIVEHKH